ncbi:hypothetical protein RJ639_002241 [Escallonia herrerae]|uniref:PUA domain-containing protein n=1 Tax=Escallonia herrerae TaxID=1293975 RepID=A0AA88XFT1_9ASTE|nr:hypothetical protein RJ639_002241 [Escallonia herrerae]
MEGARALGVCVVVGDGGMVSGGGCIIVCGVRGDGVCCWWSLGWGQAEGKGREAEGKEKVLQGPGRRSWGEGRIVSGFVLLSLKYFLGLPLKKYLDKIKSRLLCSAKSEIVLQKSKLCNYSVNFYLMNFALAKALYAMGIGIFLLIPGHLNYCLLQYPGLEPVLDDLLPKKSPLIVAKCPNHLNLVVVNNVPLFFNIRDGPYMPTLRLLHQYPDIMKKLQVDRGAIKFVLAGANIMCPGLTSPGGVLDENVGEETPVAIMAEGKQHALAIGFTKMSAKDIKAINKGIGVDNMHYLNDGLWKVFSFFL